MKIKILTQTYAKDGKTTTLSRWGNAFKLVNKNKMEISEIYNAHIRNILKNIDHVSSGKSSIEIHKYNEDVIKSILTKAEDVFKTEKTVINLTKSCIIIGDLHGQILDLYRIFKIYGLPPSTKYLFLAPLLNIVLPL